MFKTAYVITLFVKKILSIYLHSRPTEQVEYDSATIVRWIFWERTQKREQLVLLLRLELG